MHCENGGTLLSMTCKSLEYFLWKSLGSKPSLAINNKKKMGKPCSLRTEHNRKHPTPGDLCFLT